MAAVAPRLERVTHTLLGGPPPLRLRAWDGSEAGPADAPVLLVRHRRALRRLLYRPGEMGLARAWVAGEVDVPGDLYAALRHAASAVDTGVRPSPSRRARLNAVRELLSLAGPGGPPNPPPEEARRRTGPRHGLRRDQQAISHHYDVGNAFYRLVLGPSMTYSCAYWPDPGSGAEVRQDTVTDPAVGAAAPGAAALDAAQAAKHDLICRKLGLRAGQRLLDVGCGWGSMVLHAAERYGVHAVGVTLSREQAALARERVARAGLSDRVEIRVQDYREVTDGPFDAVSSVGMAEHVGDTPYLEYARLLRRLLRPGGRLLNHQIARPPLPDETAYRIDPFIDAYVFPDGELAPVGRTVSLLESAGFEVRDLESLREHYALTLRQWVRNLEEHWAEAVRLTSPGRARVWRLYMAASALAFEHARIGVNQILAVRTTDEGSAGLPLRARRWTAGAAFGG